MTLTAERLPVPTDYTETNPYISAWESDSEAEPTEGEIIAPDRDATSELYDNHDTPIQGLDIAAPATERASSRLGNMLRSSADKADSFSESTAEIKDVVSSRLRGIGRSALTRTKNAGMISLGLGIMAGEAGVRGVKTAADKSGDVLMTGFENIEKGMDKAGTAIAGQKAKAAEGYQTFQFNRETKSNSRQFKKEYAKETKVFDKAAAKEAKVQAKHDKIDLKAAAREDKRFERSMNKKIAQERRAERRARWSSNWNALKQTGASGIDTIKNVADTAKEKAEQAKRKTRVARTAGKMALQTYRDTSEAFKHN